MKKIILFYVFLMFSYSLAAQQFQLRGERHYNPNNWDSPKVRGINQDGDGDFYIYIDESSQPRNPELVRFNVEDETWQDLSQGNYMVPSTSNSEGVVMEDGSVYVGLRSFDSNYYGYRLFPDGTFEPIGSGITTNSTGDVGVSVALTNDGDFYVFSALSGGSCSAWDGVSWSPLPDIDNGSPNSVLHQVQSESDNDGTVYVTFQEGIQFSGDPYQVIVKKQDSNNNWEEIFQESFAYASNYPELFVVDSKEIYLSYQIRLAQNEPYLYRIKKYDGTDWVDLGQLIEYEQGQCGSADLVKLESTGEIYFSNCNSIFRYNEGTNTWDELVNDIEDGGIIGAYADKFHESNEGTLINILGSDGNGLTMIEYIPETLGLDTFNSPEFSIYPNPAVNNVHFSNSQNIVKSVEVLSFTGRRLASYKFNYEKEFDIDLSKYTIGLYFIKINNSQTYKVVKN